jgi:hypothetical protein
MEERQVVGVGDVNFEDVLNYMLVGFAAMAIVVDQDKVAYSGAQFEAD